MARRRLRISCRKEEGLVLSRESFGPEMVLEKILVKSGKAIYTDRRRVWPIERLDPVRTRV